MEHFQVQTCKVKRGAKDKVLRDAIAASENLKNKLAGTSFFLGQILILIGYLSLKSIAFYQ